MGISVLEVMPHIRSEVIGGKYVVQYIFAAGATAAVDPLIGCIGVGWTFTICKPFNLPCSISKEQYFLTGCIRCLFCPFGRLLRLGDHEVGTRYAALG